MNRTLVEFHGEFSNFNLNLSKKLPVKDSSLQIVNLALNCSSTIYYRFIQVEFVLAFGGLKPQLQAAHLTSKRAAINSITGIISFVFILQI
jgi:hypothetical protein